jgi:gentisate 1,2-dioxygenase
MDLSKFDRELEAKQLSGYWSVRATGHEPESPYLWKWVDVFGGLMKASESVGFELSERRSIRLVRPNIPGRSTSRNLQFSFSIINPGEIAKAHRHNLGAVRFVVKGRNAYTIVEGERFLMEEGDLILTPNWTWHDHINESAEPIIWLDGLDAPLIQALNILFFEQHSKDVQAITRAPGESERTFGFVRPAVGFVDERPGVPFRYSWESTYRALKAMTKGDPDSHDGYLLRYLNPATGGYTLPTMSCEIQLFPAKTATISHRHTSAVLYHVFKGSGRTYVGEGSLEWEKGDSFVVPLWQRHRHENPNDEEAVLFSINDRPILESLGLYREEA